MRLPTRWIALFVAGLLITPPARANDGEPLTLRRAVALAVQNSRELALARVRQGVAEREAGVSRSFFLPNLYTGSGAAFSSGFPLDAPSIFRLQYVQTIFNRPLTGQLRAAEQRAQAEKLAVGQARDAVILRAATAYLELVKVRHSLRLLTEERASAEKVVGVTQQRSAEGLELPIEVTRAQLTAARAAQRILQLEGREEWLDGELRRLTGIPPGQKIEVNVEDPGPAGKEEWSAASDQPPAELVSLALANSLELKAAEYERRARAERLKGERGGSLPTMDLISQYAVLARFNNYADFYRKFQRHNVNVGVQVRIPIFSARTSAAVSLAKSELDAADLELAGKRAEIEASVRQKARLSRELDAGREVARLELKLAQENLHVVQARFEEGRANLRDLEIARIEEHARWQAFLDSDFERSKAQLELARLTGQLSKLFP